MQEILKSLVGQTIENIEYTDYEVIITLQSGYKFNITNTNARYSTLIDLSIKDLDDNTITSESVFL